MKQKSLATDTKRKKRRILIGCLIGGIAVIGLAIGLGVGLTQCNKTPKLEVNRKTINLDHKLIEFTIINAKDTSSISWGISKSETDRNVSHLDWSGNDGETTATLQFTGDAEDDLPDSSEQIVITAQVDNKTLTQEITVEPNPTLPPAANSITITNKTDVLSKYTWNMSNPTPSPSAMPTLTCRDSNGTSVTATYSISNEEDLTGVGLLFSTTSGTITGNPTGTLTDTSFTITATYQGFIDTVNTSVKVSTPTGTYNIDGTNWPGYVSGGWITTDYVIDTGLKTVTYQWDNSSTKVYVANNLTIPNEVFYIDQEYEVVIGEYAFASELGVYLTGTLTIPDSITSIGEGAFFDCSGLDGALTIPDSVGTIGQYAFFDCSGLDGALTIGSGVTTIGNWAFNGCSGLDGALTIPDSVGTIGEGAFNGCSSLDGALTIGSGVTTIGNWAFNDCSGLDGALTIPDSVGTIGEGAFSNCSGLDGALVIGDSVGTIGEGAFSNCSGLDGALTIPDSVGTIGANAFNGCSSLDGALTIGTSVTTIGNAAFSNCSGLDGALTIPDSVETIGQYAFNGCSSLDGALTIGSGVTTIGNWAFNGCSGINEIQAAFETEPTIGPFAFYGLATNGTVHNSNSGYPSATLLTFLKTKGLPTIWNAI